MLTPCAPPLIADKASDQIFGHWGILWRTISPLCKTWKEPPWCDWCVHNEHTQGAPGNKEAYHGAISTPLPLISTAAGRMWLWLRCNICRPHRWWVGWCGLPPHRYRLWVSLFALLASLDLLLGPWCCLKCMCFKMKDDKTWRYWWLNDLNDWHTCVRMHAHRYSHKDRRAEHPIQDTVGGPDPWGDQVPDGPYQTVPCKNLLEMSLAGRFPPSDLIIGSCAYAQMLPRCDIGMQFLCFLHI